MIPPARTAADRARVHIKALIDEAKNQGSEAPGPTQMFFSGMLSGLAASVEILDGGTAEKSMELMVQRLSAAIGQAYLAGKLPPQPPTEQEAGDSQLSREEEIRGVQAWMALDVHQALGWSLNGGEPYQGRKSWGNWWAELLAEVRERTRVGGTLSRVREFCELTIQHSVRVDAIDQARDTLAILDKQPTSPAGTVTALGTPVTTADPAATETAESPLRDQIDNAVHQALMDDPMEALPRLQNRITDAVLAVVLPTTRLTAELGRSAEDDVQRVTELYERWVKAGPPPIGVSVSRWWDARLVELRQAVHPPADAPRTRHDGSSGNARR